MQKRGEVNVFIFIIALIIVLSLLIFGLVALQNLFKTLGSAELLLFTEEIKEDIKQMEATKTTKEFSYAVPNNIKSIIIVDPTYKALLLENPEIQNHPLLLDSVQSGEKKNIFLFSRSGQLISSDYVGEIGIGKFGSNECNGIGIINNTGTITIPIQNKPREGIILGKDCIENTIVSFIGPFEDSLFPQTTVFEIVDNQRKIQLKKDVSRSGGTRGDFYFLEGSFNTTPFDLSTSSKVDRIFFKANLSGGSNIKLRIGFKKLNGEWEFFGPDITATSNHEKYYYTISGDGIRDPGYEYTDLKVEVYLFAGRGERVTPSLEWINILIKEPGVSKEYCINAAEKDLCEGLDLVFGSGSKKRCCESLLSSSHEKYDTCCAVS